MDLHIVSAFDAPQEVRILFEEYTQMLIDGDPSFAQYLAVQNYDEEIQHLEFKYGPPNGRLYLAYIGDVLAGCIGLKYIDKQRCEMKRLYVRPKFRGKQLGEQLVARILAEAKDIGYSHILLDTLPFLQGALKLYQKLGFHEIPCYNNSPMDASIYMQLDL